MADYDFDAIATQYLGPKPEAPTPEGTKSPPARGDYDYDFDAIATQYLGPKPTPPSQHEETAPPPEPEPEGSGYMFRPAMTAAGPTAFPTGTAGFGDVMEGRASVLEPIKVPNVPYVSPYIEGAAEAASNVPGGLVNLGAGLSSQAFRGGRAATQFGMSHLYDATGDMEARDAAIESAKEDVGRLVDEVKHFGIDIGKAGGAILGGTTYYPRKALETMADAFGLEGAAEMNRTIDQFREEHGVTIPEFRRRFQEDPVGTLILFLPYVKAGRVAYGKLPSEAPSVTMDLGKGQKGFPDATFEPRPTPSEPPGAVTTGPRPRGGPGLRAPEDVGLPFPEGTLEAPAPKPAARARIREGAPPAETLERRGGTRPTEAEFWRDVEKERLRQAEKVYDELEGTKDSPEAAATLRGRRDALEKSAQEAIREKYRAAAKEARETKLEPDVEKALEPEPTPEPPRVETPPLPETRFRVGEREYRSVDEYVAEKKAEAGAEWTKEKETEAMNVFRVEAEDISPKPSAPEPRRAQPPKEGPSEGEAPAPVKPAPDTVTISEQGFARIEGTDQVFYQAESGGKAIAEVVVNISPDGKTATVSSINKAAGFEGQVGPANVARIRDLILERHPGVETIKGQRTTGVRGKAKPERAGGPAEVTVTGRTLVPKEGEPAPTPKGKARPKKKAPPPDTSGVGPGSTVKVGRGLWYVVERDGDRIRISKNPSGRGKKGQTHWTTVDKAKPSERTKGQGKGRPPRPMPENARGNPEGFVDWLEDHGGLMADDPLLGKDGTATVLDNYLTKKGNRRPFLVREKGRTIEEIAENEYADAGFQSPEAMVDWLRDEFPSGKREAAPGRRAPGEIATEEEHFAAQETKQGMAAEDAAAAAEKKGAKLTEEEALKGLRDPERYETVDPAGMKEGEVYYVPEKGDVYRVTKTKEGLKLEDGTTHPVNDFGPFFRAKKLEAAEKGGGGVELYAGIPIHKGPAAAKALAKDAVKLVRYLRDLESQNKNWRKALEDIEKINPRLATMVREQMTGEKKQAALPGMEGAAEAGVKGAEKAAALRKGEAKRDAAAKKGQGDMFDLDTQKAAAEEGAKVADKKAGEKAQMGLGLEDARNAAKGVTREAYDKAAKNLRPKLFGPKGLADITAAKEMVTMAAHWAEVAARMTGRGVAQFSTWARLVTRDVFDAFQTKLTSVQLNKLWRNEIVRKAKFYPMNLPRPAMPGPRGRAKAWKRAGGYKGERAAAEYRQGVNRLNLAFRHLEQQTKKIFRKLTDADQQQLYLTARGIVRKNPDGSYQFGSVQRAGELQVPRGKKAKADFQKQHEPGHLLEDGRMVGGLNKEGTALQLYRFISKEQAKARYENLKKSHPEAAKVLDRFIEAEEGPIMTAAGDRLPSFSRSRLKDQFGIEGLDPAEATHAADLFKRATGSDILSDWNGKTIPNEFSWVPDAGMESTTLVGRARNSLRGITASTRLKKTGKAAEKVEAGELQANFAKATLKTRKELIAEEIHNDVAARILAVVAEPLSKSEAAGGKVLAGYTAFSKTGLFGESRKAIRFMNRHKQWFKDQGINVADTNAALFQMGGKGYKIPTRIARDLGALFDQPSARRAWMEETNPRVRALMKATDSALGDMIQTINIFRLTRVSTAVRNIAANQFIFTAKAVRDLYRGMYQQIPGLKFQEAPFQDFFSDIRAMGTSLSKRSRQQLPPEVLGSTLLMEMETGTLPRIGGRMLRMTGFNFADIYTKRLIMEAVIDSNARQSWSAAVKMRKTGGKTKAEYVKEYREGVPREIQELAYREMDLWGGYDYANVPGWLAKMKVSKIGRSVVPYPTYYYKLWTTYSELYGAHNVKTLMSNSATKTAKVQALSNLSAGVTMAAIAWKLMGPEGELPEGIKEYDLPYDVQKFGRMKLPIPKKIKEKGGMVPTEDAWVRLYDMPFLGEVMAARAIWGKELTFADYINDRIALGPLFNTVAIMSGLSNRFNKKMPRAARFGREVSSWIPFHAEAGTVRKLADPWKRQPYREDQAAFKNFIQPILENYPGLSGLFPKRTDTHRLSKPRYHPAETLLSWGFLNVHFIDSKKREAAIELAEIQGRQESNKRFDEDRLGNQIETIMDATGETVAGKVRMSAKTWKLEIESRKTNVMAYQDLVKAFDSGGREALATKAHEIAEGIDDEYVEGKFFQYAASLARRLHDTRKYGLVGREILRAPKIQRDRLLKETQKIPGYKDFPDDSPWIRKQKEKQGTKSPGPEEE